MPENEEKLIPSISSNFVQFRKSRYYYIDKTGFIPELEKNRYAIFLRPRKFGKSLFLEMLRCYYDVNEADRFEELFAETRIHEKPTASKNSYLVLNFDFSNVKSETAEAETSFNKHILIRISDFLARYSGRIPKSIAKEILREQDACCQLQELLKDLARLNLPVYVMIDEYDNFTNSILAGEGLGAYTDLTHGSGFLKHFFAILKSAAQSSVDRIFITGVSPMTLDDVTSGFNIAENLSMEPTFSDMLGFSNEELRTVIDYYIERGVVKGEPEELYERMTDWFARYRFSADSEITVANPTMVFNYLRAASRRDFLPDFKYDENLNIDYEKIRHLVTIQKKLNGSFERLEEIVTKKTTSMILARSFQASSLTKPQNFASLLYYYGLITHGESDPLEFRIPNKMMEIFLASMIPDAYSDIYEIDPRIDQIAGLLKQFSMTGDLIPVIQTLASVVKDSFSHRSGKGGENVVQAVFESILLMTHTHYLAEMETPAGNGYIDIALKPLFQNAPNIRYTAIIELKYIKSDASTSQTQKLLAEARAQLERYAHNRPLAIEWNLAETGGTVRLVKAAVVFRGGDLELCEIV